jgi:hypothetical protein
MEADCADPIKLHDILQRHGLEAAWKRFEKTYLNPS